MFFRRRTSLRCLNIVLTNYRGTLSQNCHIHFRPDHPHCEKFARVFLTRKDFNGSSALDRARSPVEEYMLRCEMLHVPVVVQRTADISLYYPVAFVKLNMALSGAVRGRCHTGVRDALFLVSKEEAWKQARLGRWKRIEPLLQRQQIVQPCCTRDSGASLGASAFSSCPTMCMNLIPDALCLQSSYSSTLVCTLERTLRCHIKLFSLSPCA